MFKYILSKAFGLIVQLRNKNYDNSEPKFRIDIPIISIGNLSVGGTGKTPFVQMLSKYFLSRGLTPGIVGRGYKRTTKGELVVSDGKQLLTDARCGGDEMVMLANSLHVPVISHDSKSLGAQSMRNKFAPDVIIIDDGFQHRKLHRDIDIVIVDRATIDKPYLMPRGRLREPLESLKRADVIAFTGNVELPEFTMKLLKPNSIIIWVKPVHSNPYHLGNNTTLKYKEIVNLKEGIIAFAGIAKPKLYFDMLTDMGYNIREAINFSDHHQYTKKNINDILLMCKKNNTFNIATTEKDAAKLITYIDFFKENDIDCFIFPIALSIIYGKDDFFKLLNKMFPKKQRDAK